MNGNKKQKNPFNDFEKIGQRVHDAIKSIPKKNFKVDIKELLKAPKELGVVPWGWRERD